MLPVLTEAAQIDAKNVTMRPYLTIDERATSLMEGRFGFDLAERLRDPGRATLGVRVRPPRLRIRGRMPKADAGPERSGSTAAHAPEGRPLAG